MQMNQNTNVYRSTIAHVLNTSIVVPGSTNNTENTLRLTVVAVVTDEAANGTKISAMVKARTLQDLNVRRASYNLTVMEPQLNVVENEQVSTCELWFEYQHSLLGFGNGQSTTSNDQHYHISLGC